MLISQIVAVSKTGVIGDQGALPWHLPEDLKYFKAVTMGKTVIMGRKTYMSIPNPLEGRRVIVISKSLDQVPNGIVVASLEEAFIAAGAVDEVIIAGGESVYTATLPLTHRIYLTWVDMAVTGDSVYPITALEDFVLIKSEPSVAYSSVRYTIYERKNTAYAGRPVV